MKKIFNFQTVALIGRPNTPGISVLLCALANQILNYSNQIIFEKNTVCNIDHFHYPLVSIKEIGQYADVAIVLGGDGTMLSIGRQLAPYNIPLIGINHGKLGFITDISLNDMFHLVPEMLSGNYEYEERSLLEGRIVRNGKTIYQALALNDVVTNRSGTSGMVELHLSVDEYFMYQQRSDGLIVATPTGSTAYALAAQGPILQPKLAGILLVPIASHDLSNRPIVIQDTAVVKIRFVSGRDVNVNFDMQAFTKLEINDVIVVVRSHHYASLLHPKGWNYFMTLRKKLHWNEFPSVITS